MSTETPVKVVVDCSADTGFDASVLELLDQAAEAARAGDAETTNAKLAQATQLAAEASATPARVQVVPLNDDELAQLAVDQQASAEAAEVAEAAAATRKSLRDKLASGKATSAEVQTALAQLLGAS